MIFLLRTLRDRIYLRKIGLDADVYDAFDRVWYLAKYTDVATYGDPLAHYWRIGAAEGRDPNPLFSTNWYLARYPDVAQSGQNPLMHYLRFGAAEGRDPNPLFSTSWYLERYPDVAQSAENPLIHYLRVGAAEGRDPNPLFSTSWYVERYPDVAPSGENPLAHYWRIVRDWYLKQHPNVGSTDIGSIARHFQSSRLKGPGLDPFISASQTFDQQPDAENFAIEPPSYDLTQRNARVEADWAFLTKIAVAATAKQLRREFGKQPAMPDLKELEIGAGAATRAEWRARGSSPSDDSPPMNIVIISYGPYDNNSAIHITGFANALTALGHRVVVSAMGSPSHAGDFGLPRFRCVPHQQLKENPEILANYFTGSGDGAPDLVHCWTPRQVVSAVAHAVMGRYKCRYIVHFEDNEVAVAGAFGDKGKKSDKAMPGADLAHSMQEFIAGAAGATIIVDALKEILPEGLPFHLLQPGVDATVFAPGLDIVERARLCDALDIASDAWITVYPGNVHIANVDDMFSLYASVRALNGLGFNVHLIRTGIDNLPVIDPVFDELSRRYVTNLGFVRREWLVEILKLADFFIQPGGPDNFNNYRLPSKIPEFLAMGRPVILPKTNIGLQLQHRVNALLMERGDAAEITECVAALLTDPALADRVGQEGRRFAIEHFSWERSAKQLEGFYRQVLLQGSSLIAH